MMSHVRARAMPPAVLAVVLLGAGALAREPLQQSVTGTIWVANRGAHTIRAFDASTGAVVHTVTMSPNSQPGDLAFAKGKIYVAEEFGTPPAIAVVDAGTGVILHRIILPAGARPHHVHASAGGNLIAVGLFGTDLVAVVNTHTDELLGMWDSNPTTTNGRVHAAVFAQDDTIYLAVDVTGQVVAMNPYDGTVLWSMSVPAVHELAVTHNGKTVYATRRGANRLAVINVEEQTFHDVLTIGLPDTLRLTPNEKVLTVGLRTSPAQLAVVDTGTLTAHLVDLSAPGETTTIGGHQWTSRNGRYTFAAFEGGSNPGVAVIDHEAGHRVIDVLAYPGRPHGVDRALPPE